MARQVSHQNPTCQFKKHVRWICYELSQISHLSFSFTPRLGTRKGLRKVLKLNPEWKHIKTYGSALWILSNSLTALNELFFLFFLATAKQKSSRCYHIYTQCHVPHWNILPQLLKTCAATLIIIQRFGCEQQICPEGKWWVDCWA